jgi:glucose/arabinose dehydrogenase
MKGISYAIMLYVLWFTLFSLRALFNYIVEPKYQMVSMMFKCDLSRLNFILSQAFNISLFVAILSALICMVLGNWFDPLIFDVFASYQPVLRFSTEGEGSLPVVRDPHLHVEVVAEGLELPTTMAFLSADDILVLEKDNGTVQRIVNGSMELAPLLDVNVATSVERCMCGIAISQNTTGFTYVYLYYTESKSGDSEDIKEGKKPLGNRVYRYEFVNGMLVNPKLLLELPALPGPRHNGGAILLGPDKNSLYVPIGDVDGSFNPGGEFVRTLTQNYANSSLVDGRSGILEVRLDELSTTNTTIATAMNGHGNSTLDDGILGHRYPLNLYYAYGIRNSFGIDFDPVSGDLWDTENGPAYGDEINLVKPGFNSGYTPVQGIWTQGVDPDSPASSWNISSIRPSGLVDFGGKGNYSPPEFVWVDPVGVSAIKFFDSDKYGDQYKDDIFVADVHNGNIYRLQLNEQRTEILLSGMLRDKIADNSTELKGILFGEGFGGITDLEVGPDGYLYVVSIGQGKIFRITP